MCKMCSFTNSFNSAHHGPRKLPTAFKRLNQRSTADVMPLRRWPTSADTVWRTDEGMWCHGVIETLIVMCTNCDVQQGSELMERQRNNRGNEAIELSPWLAEVFALHNASRDYWQSYWQTSPILTLSYSNLSYSNTSRYHSRSVVSSGCAPQ